MSAEKIRQALVAMLDDRVQLNMILQDAKDILKKPEQLENKERNLDKAYDEVVEFLRVAELK